MRDTKQEIIHFWFEETQPSLWFQKNDDFDASVRDHFTVIYNMAKDGLCNPWSLEAEGCLALCLVLDQFPRNIFRGLPDEFATDERALLVSKQALSKGFDQVLTPLKRRFLYLPFEHSENMPDQNRSVDLFEAIKNEDPTGYERALRAREVIEKFGRFPERNKVLGRVDEPEEMGYLNRPLS